MFFSNKKEKCPECKSKFTEEYSFCPYCGHSMLDKEKETKDYGLLGRADSLDEDMPDNIMHANMGFLDKIVETAFNSITKSMEKQMNEAMKEASQNPSNARIEQMPNGLKITIGPQPVTAPQEKRKVQKRQITQDQMERIAKLPRSKAKTNIRRLTNKIVYELNTPGLLTLDDVFVSKLEKGYEIKAIAKNKMYANSLPVELPLHSFKLEKDKLFVEFKNN